MPCLGLFVFITLQALLTPPVQILYDTSGGMSTDAQPQLDWNQVGQPINGSGGNFGPYLALSADGRTMAVAAPFPFNSTLSGQVSVYQKDLYSQNFNQIGLDITGEPSFRSSVALDLSADGTTIAIGAPDYYGNGTNSGRGRVYVYRQESDKLFKKIGPHFYGDDENSQFGTSIGLSADGRTLVVGAPNYQPNRVGYVVVYQQDVLNQSYPQIGSKIMGERTLDNFGRSVAISADGSTIAVVANPNVILLPPQQPIFRTNISLFNKESNQTYKKSGSIAYDGSSSSLEVSEDGSTIAVIVLDYDGNFNVESRLLRVYQKNTFNQTYERIVDVNVFGDLNLFDSFISSLAMSANGTTIAVGSAIEAGRVRVYLKDPSGQTYKQIGTDIIGGQLGSEFGRSLGMSADGKTIAVSAPYYDSIVNGKMQFPPGQIRVFTHSSRPPIPPTQQPTRQSTQRPITPAPIPDPTAPIQVPSMPTKAPSAAPSPLSRGRSVILRLLRLLRRLFGKSD